jgi:hypothetical protein
VYVRYRYKVFHKSLIIQRDQCVIFKIKFYCTSDFFLCHCIQKSGLLVIRNRRIRSYRMNNYLYKIFFSTEEICFSINVNEKWNFVLFEESIRIVVNETRAKRFEKYLIPRGVLIQNLPRSLLYLKCLQINSNVANSIVASSEDFLKIRRYL